MSELPYELFDEMLDANDPEFADKLRAAMGLKPGDSVEIVTPQFDRADGVTPSMPDAWEKLHLLPIGTLKAIGCQAWDKTEAGTLMLFPAEWYDHIPDGLEIVDICGGKEKFKRGETDDDRRFGALAYGVFVPAGAA